MVSILVTACNSVRVLCFDLFLFALIYLQIMNFLTSLSFKFMLPPRELNVNLKCFDLIIIP